MHTIRLSNPNVEAILGDEKKRMKEKKREAFWDYYRPRICAIGVISSIGFILFLLAVRFGGLFAQ